MFFIANISKHLVIIQDLKTLDGKPLEIPSNQAMDLHKIKFLTEPEKSSYLELAKKKGYIKVLMQDKKEEIDEPAPQKNQTINKEDIVSIIREEISKSKDQSKILEELSKIGALLQNNNIQNTQDISKKEEKEIPIDENKLNEIHTRTIKKMTKDIHSNIQKEDVKESEVDNSWADDMSELEQF